MRRIGTGTLCLALALGMAALGPAWADDDAEEREAVETFFRDLGKAASAHDRAGVAQAFDAAGMFEIFERDGYLSGIPARERAELGAGFTLSLRGQLKKIDAIVPYREFTILRLAFPTSRRAVAYVRHEDADGATSRLRWFLVRRGGTWKVADYEDVSIGLRFTMMMGAAILSTVDRRAGFVPAAMALQTALMRLGAGDLYGADDALDALDTKGLPPVIEGVRQLLRAAVLIDVDLPEEALAALDVAESKHPDAPIAYLRRATALNTLGKPVEALAALAIYAERLADDVDSLLQKGLALAAIGDGGGALAAFEAGLADDPDYARLVGLLALALPAERRSEIRAHVLRLRHLETQFAVVAEVVRAEEDDELLLLLVDAFSQKLPLHPAGWLYRGHAHALAGDLDAAARLFRRAMDHEPDADARWTYLAPWLDTMLQLDKTVAAYAGVDLANRAEAFRYLAWMLSERGDGATLEALCAAASRSPGAEADDIGFYEAEVFFLGQKYLDAVARLAPLHGRLRASTDENAGLLHDVGDRLVRAYLRSKQSDKALAAAQAIYDHGGDPRYLAMAYAAKGDHDMALRKIVEFLDADGGDPAEVFLDPELAQVTKTEPYLTVRAVHWPRR